MFSNLNSSPQLLPNWLLLIGDSGLNLMLSHSNNVTTILSLFPLMFQKGAVITVKLKFRLAFPQEVDLGLVDVSGEAMLVGIVTAILAIPVNFPIIMVFRRTRVS